MWHILKMSLTLILSVFTLASTSAKRHEKLIFSDDFKTFNLRTWKHELTMGGGGNWEFEMYWNNRTTSYVKNGILYIKPGLTTELIGAENLVSNYTIDMWGNTPADQCTGNAFFGCYRTSGVEGNILNPITSARLRTAESFSFKYGRVEVRAKLPKGDWLWPAIWLMPRDNAYGEWPASGEIDIVECRGNTDYPTEYGGGIERVGSTLHWGPAYGFNGFPKTHTEYSLPNGTFNDDFHVFGLYWDEERLYTYIDDESLKVLDVKFDVDFWTRGEFPSTMANPWEDAPINAPFDQEFYLIFNIAVGGTGGYFVDGVANKPWDNNSRHAANEFWNARDQWLPSWDEKTKMEIDWVKVWKLKHHDHDHDDHDDEDDRDDRDRRTNFLFK